MMKLVGINKQDQMDVQFSIYELDEEQQKEYGGKKYALLQGVLKEGALEKYGDKHFLDKPNEVNYEGLFDTELECRLWCEIADLEHEIKMAK